MNVLNELSVDVDTRPVIRRKLHSRRVKQYGGVEVRVILKNDCDRHMWDYRGKYL